MFDLPQRAATEGKEDFKLIAAEAVLSLLDRAIEARLDRKSVV